MALVSTYNIEETNRICISSVLGIIYATSDEIHQYFVPGRACRMGDVFIDTLGVLLGITIILLIKKIREKV